MSLDKMWPLLWQGTLETLYMTLVATVLAYIVAVPLGVLLVISRKNGIKPMPVLNTVLGAVINFLRSIPFIILMVMLIPITRFITGKGTGTAESVIFPLFISAFPFVTRLIESSLEEIDGGIIEAAQSMGSTLWQIIFKVMLPEALPSLLTGATIAITTILGYTAMASTVGGGGLGSVAIVKGVSQRKYDLMYAASIMLVVMVQLLTVLGTKITRLIDHRQK
ncbi:MAG: methionine ABC transporter permease [Eubacteriales bacterium]|nr:methionine ABC transporter permease [Eubacteriales bacterium]